MKKPKTHKDFKIPDGYLDGFTSKLMEKLPKDAKVKEKEGFSVPQDYFKGLHNSISKKLQEEEQSKVVQLPKSKKGLYYTIAGIAAAFLLVLGITYSKPEAITFEDLATSDIENYFDINTYELSSYELAEAIPESDLEAMSISETTIEETDIIDYLDTNTSDFEELNLLDYEQ